MPGIDPHTLVIVVSFQCLLISCVLAAMRASFPRTIGGIGQWAASMPLFVLASVVYSIPEAHPIVTVMLGNALFLSAMLLLNTSMLSFYEQRLPRWPRVAIFCAVIMAALAWLAFVHPSFILRLVMMSVVGTALFGYVAWLPFRYGNRSVGSVLTSVAFGWTSLICLLRVVLVLLDYDLPSELLDLSAFQVIYLTTFNVSLLIGSVGFILLINERLRFLLEYNASHDALTGILNRGAFFNGAKELFEASRRQAQPLSVALLDLDHFKQINDGYGHAAGDRVLKEFCLRVKSVLRSTDLLGRYGGEEFVLLLPGSTSEEALAIARRLKSAVAQEGDALPYTVSIGLATLSSGTGTLDELLAQADRALYQAKEKGRDRIEEWSGAQ